MKSSEQTPAFAARGMIPLDRSVLAMISGGKANVERQLVTLFRRLNDEDVETLRQAVSEEDLTGAVLASHRISGAGRMIGALGLAEASERIECAGRASDLYAVKENMAALQLEVERVNACLDAL